MSNKLVPPNFTQTPNILIDEWLPILSPTEFKLIMVIVRKTFGWHKESDTISLKQLVKATGMSKQGCINAIDGLVKHGLIFKIQSCGEYGQLPNSYRLDIEKPDAPFEDEKSGFVKNVGGGGTNPIPEVVHTVYQQSKAPYIYKETITKENGEAPPPLLEKGKHVKVSEKVLAILCEEYGKEAVEGYIVEMDDHCSATGKRYKDYDAALRNWIKRGNQWKPLNGNARQGASVAPRSIYDQNQDLARKVVEKFKGSQINAQIEACNGYVEIAFHANCEPFSLNYSENGFRDQLLNQLRKMNLNTVGL